MEPIPTLFQKYFLLLSNFQLVRLHLLPSTPELSSPAFSRPNTPKPINELRPDEIDQLRTPPKISELKALSSSILKTLSPDKWATI